MQRNEQMYHHCLQHMGRHVKADMADQQTFYGFVENVDAENVYLIVLESDNGNNGYDHHHGGYGHGQGHQLHGHHQHGHHPGNDHYYGHGNQHHGHGHQDGQWGHYQPQMDQRVFGGGYGYPGYGPGYGYGGFGAPGFRWSRLALPLAGLAAISLLF